MRLKKGPKYQVLTTRDIEKRGLIESVFFGDKRIVMLSKMIDGRGDYFYAIFRLISQSNYEKAVLVDYYYSESTALWEYEVAKGRYGKL